MYARFNNTRHHSFTCFDLESFKFSTTRCTDVQSSFVSLSRSMPPACTLRTEPAFCYEQKMLVLLCTPQRFLSHLFMTVKVFSHLGRSEAKTSASSTGRRNYARALMYMVNKLLVPKRRCPRMEYQEQTCLKRRTEGLSGITARFAKGKSTLSQTRL